MICVYSEYRIKEVVCIISLTTSILFWSYASSLLCLVIATWSLIKRCHSQSPKVKFSLFFFLVTCTILSLSIRTQNTQACKRTLIFCIDIRLQTIWGQTLPFTQKTDQVRFYEHTMANWILAPDLKTFGAYGKKSCIHLTEGRFLNQFSHTTANPRGQY